MNINIGDKVKASKEYGGKSGTVIDKRGSFVVVKYTNGESEIYHESDLVKKMENGGTIKIGDKIKLNDDGVIRTYTVTKPGMRHPSERLQEGDVYLTSPGVMGFDASIDWVKQNMIHDKMATGGGIENKKKITLHLDSLTDSTYFSSSYGTFRYGYNNIDVVVNMVNKQYGYAKMKGKFAVIDVEVKDIEGNALNKLIFNTKEEAVSYINDKLTDADNKFGQGGNMKNAHMMEDGGVVGQEIVFDDNGETNTGVIKEIHEITGDYIVSTDDDRTVLAQKEFDVISLGKMRKQPETKKRFMFFEDGGKMVKGGNLDSKSLFDLEYGDVFKIDRNPQRPHTMTGQYFLFIGFSEKYAKSEGVTIEAAYFPGSFYGAKYDQYKEHAYLGGLKNGDITIISKSEAGEMLLDYYLQNDKFEDGGKVSREKGYKVGDILDHETFTGEFPAPGYEVIDILGTDDSASFSSRPRSVLRVKNLKTGQISEINEGRFTKYKMEDGGNIAKENNEMLHSQAKEAKHHIEELHNIINNKTKVEPWVVAKMTRAKTDLSDITHYLEGASHKMAKGGKLTDEQQNKFDKVMHEWKAGKLHSGSANGPIVKSQDQAIAIAYSEAYGMDKMLFGGMVNDLSDDAIDRMEGLVPISTLGELLDNAKFIIADMYEEGFEKDEIMSFLAYKISQIGSGKMQTGGNVDEIEPMGYKRKDAVEYGKKLVDNGVKHIEIRNNLELHYPGLKSEMQDVLNDILDYKDSKMQTGGGVDSLAPNLLMELWYAVWERKTDKYDEIAKKLDKEGVSFTIQNKVSEDAQNTRSRKAIDTFEVQDRIKKIMGNTKMSNGGAVKGSKPSTGEKFGVVVGSKKHSDEYINNGTEVNVRKSYGSRISEVKLIFDADNNLFEVIDYGSALDGYPNTSAGSGTKYNADKKETKKLLSQMYNASFATKLLDDISTKMAKGGGVGSKKQDYIEVTNGDTILSLEKTNGVWEEVDVLQGVKPMNFGRNTYKGNLQQEALIKALNAEYGGGYKVAYVYMNMNGGKMNTGGNASGWKHKSKSYINEYGVKTSETLDKIIKEARDYMYNSKGTWARKTETIKMQNLRNRFKKEADRIGGVDYTLSDSIA